MEGISDPNLRAYIVWLPVLPSGAHEPAARRETKRIRDNRAMPFFDAEARAGKAYSSILHLPSGLPAWDVYLGFGAEVRWESNPPVPAYWMHQLGRAGPPELRLDGEQLERVVSGLLSKSGRPSANRQSEADAKPVRRLQRLALQDTLGLAADAVCRLERRAIRGDSSLGIRVREENISERLPDLGRDPR